MTEQTPAEMLAEFHGACGQPYGHGTTRDVALRIDLHREENLELIEALRGGKLASIAQELADVVYVAYGTAHALGIPLDAVLAEVHRANMTKFGEDGKPVFAANGKVVKSDRFTPPDVDGVLAGGCPCCLGDPRLVCDACGSHDCWAGNFMCEDAKTAGVTTRWTS